MKKHFTKIILITLLFVSNQHTAQSLFSKKKKPIKEVPKKDKEGIKPYEKVITKDAKSESGLFQIHKIKNKYFYQRRNKRKYWFLKIIIIVALIII